MRLGKIKLIFILLNVSTLVFAEEKITTVPLVNLENLKPSFEKEDSEIKSILKDENIILKEKKNFKFRK